MQNMLNFIDILIPYALIVLIIYLLISLFFLNGYAMAKVWFKKLYKAQELTFVLIFIIIFFYPFLFLSLFKDWIKKNKSMDDEGFSMMGEAVKQLHVDLHDDRRDTDKVFFIGWRHLLGFHLPILLLWVAMWLSIINFIMIKFF